MVSSEGDRDKLNSDMTSSRTSSHRKLDTRLLFATTNKAKLEEVIPLAESLGVRMEGLGDFMTRVKIAEIPAVREVGTTYYDNAREKARAYALWSGVVCVADDSGIEVESLRGLPGVYTAGFGFSRLRAMFVPGVNYPATFRCQMCFAEPSGRTISVEGSIHGVLSFPHGAAKPSSSVPYSHFFTPSGEIVTLAELTARGGYESHRAKALERLLRVIDLTCLAGDRE
jgi:XTP/dITP diphosphohydrolase